GQDREGVEFWESGERVPVAAFPGAENLLLPILPGKPLHGPVARVEQPAVDSAKIIELAPAHRSADDLAVPLHVIDEIQENPSAFFTDLLPLSTKRVLRRHELAEPPG